MINQAEQSFTFNDFGRLLVQNKKQAGMYGLFFVIVSFNLGLFLPANMHTPAAERMINGIQLLCFAVMGIINVWIFNKPVFLEAFPLSAARLAFICLLFVVISLVLFIYYYVSGNNGLEMAFASGAAFLLPFLIYQGWVEFMGIPIKTYPVWHLPADATAKAATMALPGVNAMQVQLKIARRLSDDDENTFPVTTSGKLKLGTVFERFVEEQRIAGEQTAIETSSRQRPFGWQFFVSEWGGIYSRYLNPGMSLLENKLKSNAKITIVRIHDEAVAKFND